MAAVTSVDPFALAISRSPSYGIIAVSVQVSSAASSTASTAANKCPGQSQLVAFYRDLSVGV